MPKPYTSPTPETQVEADPVLERRTRRTFSADYKLRIIAQADQCAHGELGVLLRREKLYSAQLQQWRREFADAGVNGVSKTTPGPRAKRSAEQREIDALRRRNAQLNRQLEIANGCLDLQKKALAMRDQANIGSDV